MNIFTIYPRTYFANLTMNESFTLFNNGCCQQFDGVVMYSLLGPTFANIFRSLNEVIWPNNLSLEFKPKIYRRHVDDTFLLFENAQQVQGIALIVNI